MFTYHVQFVRQRVHFANHAFKLVGDFAVLFFELVMFFLMVGVSVAQSFDMLGASMNDEIKIVLLVRSTQRLSQVVRFIRRMRNVHFPSIRQMQ